MEARHRRHHRRRRNPLNGGKDFVSGVGGLVFGGLIVFVADRLASTNPVTDSGQKDSKGQIIYTDTPAVGHLYNGEAPLAPIWSNWKRLAAAGIGVVLPFGISAKVRGAAAKSFFQLAGLGALGFVGVKVATDVATKFLGGSKWGTRLLAPEVVAHNDVVTTGPQTLNQPMPMPTMAGLPFGLGGGRPPSGNFRSVGATFALLNTPPPGYILTTAYDPVTNSCPPGAVYVQDPNNLDVPLCYAPAPPPAPPPPPAIPPPMAPPPGNPPPMAPPPGNPPTVSPPWSPPPSPQQPCPTPAPCPPQQPCPPGWQAPGPQFTTPAQAKPAGACCQTCAKSPCGCQSLDWASYLAAD